MAYLNVGFVRGSKIRSYETPYTVTGSIQQTGLKEAPKSICTDKKNWNVES